jgi:hypothetical protein
VLKNIEVLVSTAEDEMNRASSNHVRLVIDLKALAVEMKEGPSDLPFDLQNIEKLMLSEDNDKHLSSKYLVALAELTDIIG